MRKRILCCFCVAALLVLLLPLPVASAKELPYETALNNLMMDSPRREYVQTMLKYYLAKDSSVRKTLRDGLSAIFFFEGCSDNMDHPELHDISYYRVSAVCIGIRLNICGEPYLVFFNQDCSTLPDRPSEFVKRKEGLPDPAGPATVRDGTYELFSVRHGGAYEALHVRTSLTDGGVPAVYLTPNGYVTHDATLINIHTRTNNHVLKYSMWSAGCLLVGNGDFREFQELMESTYYAVYDEFVLYLSVGTVTIDRYSLKEALYELYGARDAVDMIVANSRHVQPETYLQNCSESDIFEEEAPYCATEKTTIMSLPCSEETDVRSRTIGSLDTMDEIRVVGTIRNTRGSTWYIVDHQGQRGYVFSKYLYQPGWLDRILHDLFE